MYTLYHSVGKTVERSMSGKLGKKVKAVLWCLFFIALAIFVCLALSLYDFLLVTPIHERGHLFGCWIFGLKVIKVAWSSVEFVPVSDWRDNAVGFMGGLFGTLFSLLMYLLLSVMFKLLDWRVRYRVRLSVFVANFFVVAKSVVMADILIDIIAGIFEGSSLSLYHQVFGPTAYVLSIAFAFSCISLFWQLRELLKK
jgi:hypothetical protein